MIPQQNNESLYCPETLRLGEFHWYLLKADRLMAEQTFERYEGDDARPNLHKRTEFGKEVGPDEIHWWVFRREQEIGKLEESTRRALGAAQRLKLAADCLRTNRPKSYGELLDSLRRFAELHTADIDKLVGYVQWLSDRDILAPKILYTYRVWGSTRMGERWASVNSRTAGEEDPRKIQQLAEIVLGLSSGRGLTHFETACYEVHEEIWNSMIESQAESEGTAETVVEIPMDRVIPRAAQMIFEDCAIYFAEVRDSLRNILLDAEKFVEQQDVLTSDKFWRAFVGTAIRTQKCETQLWDFKQTLPMWHMESGPEREKAKLAFAEDVASFANADGGVLLIGVSNSRAVVGLGQDSREVENRLKSASDAIARHVEYCRDLVRFRQVVVPDERGAGNVCLIVIVAQSCEVVGVHDGQGQYTYPIRRETGLARESSKEIITRKMLLKSDNCDFLRKLQQFVRED